MENIRIKNFKFLSSNNYYDIHGVMWIPEGKVRAIVQISHGMAEYIERYDDFARFLGSHGILVVGNDHMGHGKSINEEKNLGYFSVPIIGLPKKYRDKFSSGALVVKDLHRITMQVKKHYKNVPYILLGHSMGSFMARRYMMEYGDDIDGAILIGTGNSSDQHIKMGKTLLNSIGKVKGDRYKSKLAYDVMYAGYNSKVPNKKTDNDWICSDENVIERYNNDSKCGFMFPINGLKALVWTIDYVTRPEHVEMIPKNLKTLFLSGQDDPVGAYGEEVKIAYENMKIAGIRDVKMKLYKGMRHEILNEVHKEIVYEDIYKWICKEMKL